MQQIHLILNFESLKFVLYETFQLRSLTKGEVLLSNDGEISAIFLPYFGEKVRLDKKINLDDLKIT